VLPLNRFLFPQAEDAFRLVSLAEPGLTADRVKQRALALATKMQGQPSGAWVLWSENPLSFLCGLLALWQLGSPAVLIPNCKPDTLNLALQGAVGLLSDEPALQPRQLLDFAPAPCELIPAKEVPLEQTAVIVFTSGSTGQPKPIPKRLAQLHSEIAGLEREFGAGMGQRPLLATLGHSHLYGLLFRLLWPLCASRLIPGQNLLIPEEVKDLAPCTLASSPTFLSLLAQSPVVRDLSHLRLIFSSGGALAEEPCQMLLAKGANEVVEIFGSSETGGVAQRRNRQGQPRNEVWQPLRGVQVRAGQESRMQVLSPFAQFDPNAGWLDTQDLIQCLPSGEFAFQGRGDRIAKIGEKRIALKAVEDKICEHTLVSSAVVLATDHLPGKKQGRLAAVVEWQGEFPLSPPQRRQAASEIRALLAARFEEIAFPKYWRFVSSIERNPVGKPEFAALLQLFAAEDNS